jgi:hypothetical protein
VTVHFLPKLLAEKGVRKMKVVKLHISLTLLVIILIALAACSAQEEETVVETAVAQATPTILPTNTAVSPTATATPPPHLTATSTSRPAPTATPTPAIPHLYVTGAHISTAGWSSDSQWLAYWLSTEEDLAGLDSHTAPGGTLHLLNSSSGQSCALPQFRTAAGGYMSLSWEADNSLIVQDWEAHEQWHGQPCRPDSFVRLADRLSPPDSPDGAVGLSPDGRFRITLELLEEEADHWRTMLTVLEEVDGPEITAVTWRTQATFAENNPGGEWLSATHFFIRLAEAGPLLLDAKQPGAVIDIRSEIFGLEQSASEQEVIALPGPTPDSFYLRLSSDRWGNAPAQLYHADSGLIETLPYQRSASPAVSPDGQWMIMYEEGGNDFWMRRLADVEGEWRLLGKEISNNLRWNTDVTEVALSQFWQVTWQTFPEGDLIGQWSTEPFTSMASGWSPDGRFLVVMGLPEIGWYRQALFLFDRDDGWHTYENEFLGYRFSYPPEARVRIQGLTGFPLDELPEEMTVEAYQTQLEATYPDDLCVSVGYQNSFITFVPAAEAGGRYTVPCGVTGVGDDDLVEVTETFLIDGRPCTAGGLEFYREGVWQGVFYFLPLTEHISVHYGKSQGSQALFLDAQETLRQIISSFRSEQELICDAN